MHHNVLLVAAGLICPIFAVPNVNNRLNLRRVHRQRELPTPILSVGPPTSVGPYKPPTYGLPPDDVSVAAISGTTTSSPDSTSTVYVDPVLSATSTSSACSVIRITEYVTVYGTPISSTSSPGNFTSAPYGWNSSVAPVTTSTSEPLYPISNSTNSTAFTPPGAGYGTSLPTFVNITTTTVNFTLLPTSFTTPVVVPSNFTSFPNITTTTEFSATLLPIPVSTPSGVIPGNFTTFANVSSIQASTTADEPTTIIVPGVTTTSSVSLVINPSLSPIEVATSTSTGLVIVTTLPPLATASITPSELPTTVVTATATVSNNAPTGTPSPEEIHCGIRGTALGTYYLATYAYNRANVPVTLLGCYQFCSFAVEQCYSYEYYLEPGLGSPRCKLYGGLVAYEVDSIDPFQPFQWFDVSCGDPTKFPGTK